jgi:MFS family permease
MPSVSTGGSDSAALRSPARILAIATAATVVSVMPVFLTGALAPELRRDLVFGATGIGLAVSGFRLSGVIFGRSLGRFADAHGAIRSLRLGALIAAGGALAITLFARNLPMLVALLFITGAGQALAQPAANRLIIHRIPLRRQGFAFGLKQSAPPTASLVAGLSLPLIGLTLGWRWGFALVPILTVLLLLVIGRPPAQPLRTERKETSDEGRPSSGMVVILMIAFGLGTAAGTTLPAFYVDAAVRVGTAASVAGGLLAAASLAAISVRVAAGVLCDRIVKGHMRLAGGLLAVGSLGILLLATGTPSLMAVGVILGLAGAWGFNGVFWYALMRAYPTSPGTTTGAVAPGGLVGGIVGPTTFGLIVDVSGYGAAWILSTVLALASASAMIVVARRLEIIRQQTLAEGAVEDVPPSD